MNSTTHDLRTLQEQGKFMEKLNALNMFTTLVLIVFGLAGNVCAFLVLVRSRKRSLRITGSSYLIILTLANVCFLLIQFYIGTYNRIIFYFGIDYKSSLQLLDSNEAFCKILPYLRYSTRFLNAAITACFSLERLFAVYNPLRTRSLRIKCLFSFKLVIVVSFLLPSYSIFFTRLVPVSDQADDMYERFNLTRTFNLYSLTPSLNNFTCSASHEHLKIFIVFHVIFFLTMFLAYLTVSGSLLAIILKLKKSKKVLVYAFRAANSSSNSGENTMSTQEQRARLMAASRAASRSWDIYSDILLRRSNSTSLNLVCTPHLLLSNSSYRSIRLVSSKIHDTKILTSISLSFVLLNLPYFATMFCMFVYVMKLEDIRYFAVSDLIAKIRLQTWFLVTEIFQLVNFSVTGLIFFCSGRIFRTHAINFFRGLFKKF